MFDAKLDSIFSIDVAVNGRTESSNKSLLVRACKLYIFSDNRIYSEFDEQTFDALNSNNGLGAVDVEFIFENSIIAESYPMFYTKCFVIRTDTGVHIKPMKYSNKPVYSKVDQAGCLVVGIRYYFKSEKEIEEIIKCKSILVEGYIALGKPKNVFGVMCQMRKNENDWDIAAAYTYKQKHARNIRNLID